MPISKFCTSIWNLQTFLWCSLSRTRVYSPYCSGLDTHCMVGLISAKLSKNADYENIKRMYQRIVKKEDFTIEMKSSFSRIVAYLEQI